MQSKLEQLVTIPVLFMVPSMMLAHILEVSSSAVDI